MRQRIEICHLKEKYVNGKRNPVVPRNKNCNTCVARHTFFLWFISMYMCFDSSVKSLSSGFVVLPSTRILKYYKNAVNQTSGFNKDMFHWMLNEVKNRNLSPEGYEFQNSCGREDNKTTGPNIYISKRTTTP
jgi:hypothetical protein